MTMLIKTSVNEETGKVTVYNGAWRRTYDRAHVNNSDSSHIAVGIFLFEVYGLDSVKNPNCIPQFSWCKDHVAGKYIYIFPILEA